MALTEQTRVRQIILDFPTAEGYTLRYRQALDLYRDGNFDQELRVSEPMPVVEVGEAIPAALAEVFGAEAADIIAGAHLAATEHEARLQEVADQRTRADEAERLAAEQTARAEEAEAQLRDAQQQLIEVQQRADAAERKLAAIVETATTGSEQ